MRMTADLYIISNSIKRRPMYVRSIRHIISKRLDMEYIRDNKSKTYMRNIADIWGVKNENDI